MPTVRTPFGPLLVPPHTPCAPKCPACQWDRIGDLERVLRDQVPDVGDPLVSAMLLVWGLPEPLADVGHELERAGLPHLEVGQQLARAAPEP